MNDQKRRELELFAAGYFACSGEVVDPGIFTNKDVADLAIDPSATFHHWELDPTLTVYFALRDKLAELSQRHNGLAKIQQVKGELNTLELSVRGDASSFKENARGFVESVRSIFGEQSGS